jgi:transposase InsO family protein
MGMARSTYYYQSKREENLKKRAKSDSDLVDEIQKIHLEAPVYGHRRLYHALLRKGILINKKKIRRLQREFDLWPIRIRAFTTTTDSKHGYRRFPNLLKEHGEVRELNEVWVTDITYIRINTGFIYLAALMDLCSRKIIGWAISKRINAELVVAALKMAIATRSPDVGCIHHSDQGVQYACGEYVELLEEWKFKISMSRKGNPYDNAAMESFFKTLKYEEVFLLQYETEEDVLERVPHFIEEVYNTKRLHSSLEYLTPTEFETKKRKSTEPLDPIQI